MPLSNPSSPARGGFTSTATSSGIITLTVASTRTQRATGSTAGRVYKLPSAGGLFEGFDFRFVNASSVPITIRAFGLDNPIVVVIPAGATAVVTCIAATADPDDEGGNWTFELFAPLISPAFQGTPLTPTPSPGDSSTKIATTAFAALLAASLPIGPGIVTTALAVDLDGGDRVLYTVPANRKLILTDFIFREFSVTLTSARIDIVVNGVSILFDNPRIGDTGPTTTDQIAISRFEASGVGDFLAKIPICVAGDVISILLINTEGSAATCTIDVVGYFTTEAGVPVRG